MIAISSNAELKSANEGLSKEDVEHNIRVNVLVAAVFQIGAADMALASGPLLVYLAASNSLIGFISGLGWMSLIGVFLSPFISRMCHRKKWYMFWAHVPYIGAWGVIGLLVVLSQQLGVSNPTLLFWFTVLSAANLFFAGFVTLPSQEFLAACIPMSHRGRYTGYSMSVGAVGSLISVSIGGVLLHCLTKPMSFGWLYCYNDDIAIAAIKASQDMGLVVPRDLSITGFDGVVFSAYTNPTLTTYKINAEQMAYEASRLCYVMSKGVGQPAKASVSQGSLIIGNSTSKPRKSV